MFDGFMFCQTHGSSRPIVGECTEEGYEEWIGVLGFDYGVDMPRISNNGQTAGRHNFRDLTVTKFVDKASPKLMESMVRGTRMQKWQVDLCRTYETPAPKPYLRIELEDALIVKVDSFCSSSYALPMEAVTFDYDGINVTYIDLDRSKSTFGASRLSRSL